MQNEAGCPGKGDRRSLPLILLLGPVCGMTALSFLRFFFHGVVTTQSVFVVRDWTLWFAGIGFLVLLGLFGYAYYRVVMNHPGWALGRSEVKALSLLAVLAATPMLPMLSGDLFSVFAYTDLVLKGISPYDDGNHLRFSGFFPYVDPYWQAVPCVYGPVGIAVTAVPVFLGGADNPLAPVLLYKIINAFFAVAFVLLISRFEVGERSQFNVHALVLLSPVLWLQGAGQAHLDMAVAALIAGALFSALKNRYALSAVLAALAFNVKITAAIVCPLLLLLLWHAYQQKPWPFVRTALACVVIFAAVTLLVWMPVYNGPQSIVVPWQFLKSAAFDTGPITGVAYRILAFFLTMPDLLEVFRHSAMGTAGFDFLANGGWVEVWEENKAFAKSNVPILKGLLTVLFLAIVVFNLWGNLRKASSPAMTIKLFAVIGTAFFTLLGNVLHPWYLLIVLTFYLYLDDREWVIWAVLTGVVIHCLDIGDVTHKSVMTSVVYLSALVTLAGVFLWKLRARYFA